MSDKATDPNIEAFARGLGHAQADAAEARTLLRGDRTRRGVLTDVELLQSDVRHADQRVTEIKELFANQYRQLDQKIDANTEAVRALANRTLHPLVTALLVVCVVALAASGVVVAGSARDIKGAVERWEHRASEGER